MHNMKFKNYFITVVVSTLSLVLFICANTTSSSMIYQPKAPDQIKAFGIIK